MTNIDPAIVEAVAEWSGENLTHEAFQGKTDEELAEHLAPLIAAAVDAARAEVLPREVERGVVCFHGTPKACLSLRCGSNCSHRFDRMHPCPACLIAERDAARAEGDKQGAARVREAVEGLCADPWTATRVFGDPRYPEGVSRRGAVGYGAFVRVDALRAALTEVAPHD